MSYMVFYSIFLAIAFICMGLYIRIKFKDKLDDLDS